MQAATCFSILSQPNLPSPSSQPHSGYRADRGGGRNPGAWPLWLNTQFSGHHWPPKLRAVVRQTNAYTQSLTWPFDLQLFPSPLPFLSSKGKRLHLPRNDSRLLAASDASGCGRRSKVLLARSCLHKLEKPDARGQGKRRRRRFALAS